MKALAPASSNISEIEAIIAERLALSTDAERKADSSSTVTAEPAENELQSEAMPINAEKPCEEITGESVATKVSVEETWRADRKGFGSGASLHSSYDFISRFDVEIIIKERRIRVETVTDLYSGKSVRADLSGLGPERSKITWASMALIICLAIEAAMPFDRLQKVLFSAFGIFSTSSICVVQTAPSVRTSR